MALGSGSHLCLDTVHDNTQQQHHEYARCQPRLIASARHVACSRATKNDHVHVVIMQDECWDNLIWAGGSQSYPAQNSLSTVTCLCTGQCHTCFHSGQVESYLNLGVG
jgi:hypothetical protein